MSDCVIEVSGMSKEYVLSHEGARSADTSLREVMASGLKRIGSRKASGEKLQPAGAEKFLALDDISFKVHQGSRLGVIGSNGAGKSTLLKILCRIINPSSGQVEVRGKVASLLEVGTGFHPELTGRENIFLNGIIMGMSRAEVRRKFDEIVAFAEVDQFLDTPVKRYSSGMYMKLAFSVSAHMEPEILIIDEVLAVGDAAFQKKCLVKMDEISKKEGRTILFVSHNIEAIKAFCTEGMFLCKGRLTAFGEIHSVIDAYVSSYSTNPSSYKPHQDKDIFFNRISVVNEEVSYDTEVLLQAEIISSRAVSQYMLGISISTNTDTVVGAALLPGKGGLRQGSNIVDFRVPLRNLVPGKYKCTTAIALQSIADVQDVVPDYPFFTIVPDETSDALFANWHNNWGGNFLAGSAIV